MQAIRETLDVVDSSITIRLPATFAARRVEFIGSAVSWPDSSLSACHQQAECWWCRTLTAAAFCASSARDLQAALRGRGMKKHALPAEELRAEYQRQDLGKLVRGKYAARLAKASNGVAIDQSLTKAFPNSEANLALRRLPQLATAAVKARPAAKKSSTRKATA